MIRQVHDFLYAFWAFLTTVIGSGIMMLFGGLDLALAFEYQVYAGFIIVCLFILFP